MKAKNETELAIGWQVERFAREGKRMKPLGEYLKPVEDDPIAKRAKDAAKVAAMFDRMIEKQEAQNGDR